MDRGSTILPMLVLRKTTSDLEDQTIHKRVVRFKKSGITTEKEKTSKVTPRFQTSENAMCALTWQEASWFMCSRCSKQ